MRGVSLILALLTLQVWMSPSFADHPKMGDIPLSALLDEGLKNSFVLKESEQQLKEAQARLRSARSVYFPQLSIDGGVQSNRFDDTESEGGFVHGTAHLNLYRGGRDEAQAKIQLEESRLALISHQKLQEDIERKISKLYYELLYLAESLHLKEQAIQINKNQMEMARKRKAAGLTSDLDVIEFEFRAATLASDLNLLGFDEDAKERELRQILGREAGPKIKVNGHLLRPKIPPSSVESLLKSALESNPDLIQKESSAKISRLEKRSRLGQFLPQIDFEGRYGKLADDDEIYERNNNHVLMLKASIPIFTGLKNSSDLRESSEKLVRNEIAVAGQKNQLKLLIEQNLARSQSIQKRLDLEENNIQRAEKFYQMTIAEYRRGVRSSQDMAGAADRLFQAKQRNLEYRKEAYLSGLELSELLGSSPQR